MASSQMARHFLYAQSIYENSDVTGLWELAGNISSGNNAANGAIFGNAVSLSGDGKVVAIGDKFSDVGGLEDGAIVKQGGKVSIYHETNGTWKEMGIGLSGSDTSEFFGWSVALSKNGNRVAISSVGGNREPGYVQMFDFNGRSWEGVGSKLIGDSIGELFGSSVELSGDGSVVAASAPDYFRDGQEASVGIVRLYVYDTKEEGWLVYGQHLEGDSAFDAFGSSVALSHTGNTVAIGAPGNNQFCDDCGHIKVFQNTGRTWNSTGSALGKSGIDGGQFGHAVALSATGNRVVGAAPSTTFNGRLSKVGQVLVFDSTVEDTDY